MCFCYFRVGVTSRRYCRRPTVSGIIRRFAVLACGCCYRGIWDSHNVASSSSSTLTEHTLPHALALVPVEREKQAITITITIVFVYLSQAEDQDSIRWLVLPCLQTSVFPTHFCDRAATRHFILTGTTNSDGHDTTCSIDKRKPPCCTLSRHTLTPSLKYHVCAETSTATVLWCCCATPVSKRNRNIFLLYLLHLLL